MRIIQDVFGKAESPAISAAEILGRNEKEQDAIKLQDDRGSVISLRDIELRMNEVSRSLISLGLVAGDTLCINQLSYDNALLLFLASEQIGVNVVHLNPQASLTEQINEVKPRATISNSFENEFDQAQVGEFVLIESSDKAIEGSIDWGTFLNLKRFVSSWELDRFRVVSA